MIKNSRRSTPVAAQGQGQTSRHALLAFFCRIDIAQVIARAFCHGGLRHADCQPCLSQQWTQKALMSSTDPSGWYITLTLLWADDAPSRAALAASSKRASKNSPGSASTTAPCAAQAARPVDASRPQYAGYCACGIAAVWLPPSAILFSVHALAGTLVRMDIIIPASAKRE